MIMISSVLSLLNGGDRTAVYINIGAMVALAIAVTVLNFKMPHKDMK